MSSRLLRLFALFSILIPFASAQTLTATVVGTVSDESGALVPNAVLRITNALTGQKRETATDESGHYALLLLPPGRYALEAEAKGFQRRVMNGITLQVDQRVGIDIELHIGAATETVEVRASAAIVQTENAGVGIVIDSRKIVDLPLNGREFQQLALLVPGAVPAAQGSSLSFRGGFNVAGARETANYFLLDGVDNTNAATNQYVFRPSVEMIEEFKVQSSTYSAEFGRGGGGQINVVTKSGTNQFHGSAFEFLRNSAFDAKNFFDAPGKIPGFKRNQFGGVLGGPIVKNKTFFFANYEGLQLRQGITRAASVPSRALINGDFSSLLTGANRVLIRDPITLQPFPGNLIPMNRLDRIGSAVARAYPAPNAPDPVRNFVSSPSQPQTFNQFSTRVDHRFSDKSSFFGRYSVNQDQQTDVFDSLIGTLSSNLPGFGREDGQRTQNASLTHTYLFSARFINELRLGYNRLRQSRFPQDRSKDVVGAFGIPGLASEPRLNGFPAFRVTGFDSIGDSTQLPQGRADNTFHFVDNVSSVAGTHTLRAGIDLKFYQSNLFNPSNSRGDFRFTGLFTGSGLADLLLGLPAQTIRAIGNADRTRRLNSYGFYIQDDWKALPRLTLNLGLRYEFNPPVYEKHNRISNFDPATGSIVAAGQNGVGATVYDANTDNIGPRLGFAWQPFGGAKTVIRGGYGIYYDLLLISNDIGGIFFNPPSRLTQMFNATLANPIALSNPFPTSLGAPPSLAPTGVQRNLHTAYLQQFSFGLQRELSKDLVADVSYVGSKGTRLLLTRNINQATPGLGSLASRRPYPAYANINFREASGSSTYHSLQARLEKRFAGALYFLASYTFAKSIDNSSGIPASNGSSNSPQNSYNLRAERGLSDFDVRHRLVFSYSYDLPLGLGKHWLSQGPAARILGGFQLAGIVVAQSGRPFTPVLSRDVSGTGQLQDRPNVIGSPILSHPDPALWFNTGAFAIPAASTFGNSGRDVLTGPGLVNQDFSLIKYVSFGEARKLEIRGEVFNLWNHPNFSLPNAIADSPQFGKIFAAGFSRQIQLGVKLYF